MVVYICITSESMFVLNIYFIEILTQKDKINVFELTGSHAYICQIKIYILINTFEQRISTVQSTKYLNLEDSSINLYTEEKKDTINNYANVVYRYHYIKYQY